MFDILNTRKDLVHSPPVEKLIFSSFIGDDMPALTRPPRVLSQLLRRWSVRSSAVKRLCERHFPAVDSLQFNYEHTGEKPCAPLVRFTATTYAALSSNLRELTITIETPQRLGLCLPAVGSLSPLPRLETMRLSFWAVPAHQVQSLAKVRMRQIVRLYTTPSLRTLEIRSKFYAIPWEFPMDSFLPSVESLGSLQTFSFWLPDDADYAPTYRGPRELLAFIRSQLATLVQVAIHGSPLIDNEFEHNPPTFRPDAALSFRVREEENWVARAPGRLRSSVLELEYFEYRGDWWPFGRLENLHVLNVHLFEIRLSLFVQLAEQLLRLTSLRLEYCNQYSQQMLHCMSLDIEAAGEDTKAALRRWGLRDLTILPMQSTPATLNHSQQLMSLAASVMPSIVTFNGHDIQDPPQTLAGTEWVWTRNKYLLSAAAKRRKAAAQ